MNDVAHEPINDQLHREQSLHTKLADQLADARNELDAAEDAAKLARAKYEAIEAAMFDAMENSGLLSIRTERGLFRLNDLAWARIEDPDKARVWAEHEMPELLTLNNSRLSKLVRDALKGDVTVANGAVDPGTNVMLPDGVTYTTSRKITWRRE